jgi:hypothetical protein
MAKNKVSEWSATPANNTDIANIDIAEGCAPSGINNAIREIMAQVKDMQTGADGDNFTVGNNLSVLNDSTFTGTVLVGETLTSAGVITGTAGFSGNLTGNVTGNVSGTSANVTGTVAVANGGTGLTTLTANNVMLGNGTSTPTFVAPSTAGNLLRSDGTTWVSSPDPFGVKAFVSFTGVGSATIRGSGNIASVVRQGVGDYLVTFTTPMPNVNYSATVSASSDITNAVFVISAYVTDITTTSCRIRTAYGLEGLLAISWSAYKADAALVNLIVVG